MMRRLIFSLILGVLACLPAGPLVSQAAAASYNPFGSACTGANESAICNNSGEDPVTGPNGIIHTVTVVISIIAGVAAVVIMVISGIRYITSNGEAASVSQAKKSIIYAAVGLVVIVVAQPIINFVLSRI